MKYRKELLNKYNMDEEFEEFFDSFFETEEGKEYTKDLENLNCSDNQKAMIFTSQVLSLFSVQKCAEFENKISKLESKIEELQEICYID